MDLFHVKQAAAEYVRAVEQWDSTHRIVGRERVGLLLEQSLEALRESAQTLTLPPTLVDIGAGSGILGFAWLFLNSQYKTVFVEPRKKSVAFLHFFLASQPELISRSLVLASKVEAVSRETVERFGGGSVFCASRAFSGGSSFEEALSGSELSEVPAYVFAPDIAESGKPKYLLRLVSSNNLNKG